MTEAEHQLIIEQLERLISETHDTLERFEAAGMVEQMSKDYEQLLHILDQAVKQQREHALAMLDLNVDENK